MEAWECILQGSQAFDRITCRRKRPQMVVVKASFDESGKLADTEIVVFGGCVARAGAWEEISARWSDLLSAKGIAYLTMKDAMSFRGEFVGWQGRVQERNELLMSLARAIQPLLMFQVAAVIRSDSLKSLPRKKQAKLRDAQYCGFEACVKDVLARMEDPDLRLHVYCDSSEQYATECLRLYLKLRREHPEFRDRCIAVTFAEDQHFPPLQAADMFAYCERHNANRATVKPDAIIDRILGVFGRRGKRWRGLAYDLEGPGLGSGILVE